ncbi:MAG TPA: hypothetical protein VFV10_02205 [Gammaproteobacteria bacterium]|nr:hypothetical protein [Gammaproteobacteria bacterium]
MTPYTPHPIEKQSPDGLWYINYPGHEAWIRIAGGDFVDVRNPTPNPLRALLNLGCDSALHAKMERVLVPEPERLPREVVQERLGRMAPLRRGFVRLGFEFPPEEIVRIPVWAWQALRVVKEGRIITGAVPQLVEAGESDPPPLHPALVTDPTPRAPAARQRRRRDAEGA